MKVIIALLLTLNVFAQFDSYLQGTFRSYPLGTALVSETGYGFKLYEKNKILYGYIRPAVHFQTSALVNYASTQLDIYPVSFFGFNIGKTKGAKSIDKLQGFDCSSVKCDGGVEKTYYSANLALAFKEYKLVNFYRRTQMDLENHQGYFAEEYSNLIGYNKDTLSSLTTLLGYDLNKDVMIGYLRLHNKMKNLNQKSTMNMLIGQYREDKKSYQLALGTFENRNEKTNFSMLLIFKYDFEKGLRLF